MKTQRIRLSDLQIKDLNILKTSKECSATELKRILAILLIDRKSSAGLIKDITGFDKNMPSNYAKNTLMGELIHSKTKKRKNHDLCLLKGKEKKL